MQPAALARQPSTPAEPFSSPDTSIQDELRLLIARESGLEPARLTREATFESLGLTSIDVVTLLAAVEQAYDLYVPMDGPLAEARDLGALLDALAARIAAHRGEPDKPRHP